MFSWIQVGAVYDRSYISYPPNGRCIIEVTNNPRPGVEGLRAELLADKRGYKLVEVMFYIGYGWLSRSELFELRQQEPRMAP